MANHWADMGDEGQITAEEYGGDSYFAQNQMRAGDTTEISVNRDAFIKLLGQRNQLAKELDATLKIIADIKHANPNEPTVIIVTVDTGDDGGNGMYANFAGDFGADVMSSSGAKPIDVLMAAMFAAATQLQQSTQPADVITFQNAVNNHLGSDVLPADGIFSAAVSTMLDTVTESPAYAAWSSGVSSFGAEGQINAAQMGDPNFAKNEMASGHVQTIQVNQDAFRELFTQRAQLTQQLHAAEVEKNALINELH
jgi:hypothetical protein